MVYKSMMEDLHWRLSTDRWWRLSADGLTGVSAGDAFASKRKKRKVHQEVFNRQASLANLEDVGRKAAIYPFVKQAGVCGVVGRWKTEWPRM